MLPKIASLRRRNPSRARFVPWTGALVIAALFVSAPRARAQTQCPFTTCGNGSDGALSYTGQTGTIYFDPVALGLKGTGDAFCVYNFTSITIPAGLTVLLSQYKVNCPVYWLSQSDVNIAGILNLAGAPGAPETQDTAVRIPAVPGSGGFSGGVGGNSVTNQNALAGSGPGGGASPGGAYGNGGSFTGNTYLVPLIGGSGGGGCDQAYGYFGPGGGAGGGAILIASSTQIIVSGTITADGGNWVSGCNSSNQWSGGGSGGAIRLVSIKISGSGYISADGENNPSAQQGGGYAQGGPGRARLEASTQGFAGSFDDIGESQEVTQVSESNPLPLLVPTTLQPSVQVTKIAGMTITENPFSFPDATINTASPVPVVITGHNVPLGTVPTLYIFSDTQDQQAIPCPGGLAGTLAKSTCTMNIGYPYADSRGFVKATWSSTPP